MHQGKQVLLYLVDGLPGGLRTAEIANWTGHIVAAPRSELSRLLQREEARRTGVYLLLGDDPESSRKGRDQVYIGESDEVATRLKQHHDKKDWWDRAVIITSQGQAQQLTKSQVRFIESKLIQRAKLSARAALDNGTNPGFSLLSEAETSNMEYFIEQLLVLLPAIGVDVFRGVSKPSASQPATLPLEFDRLTVAADVAASTALQESPREDESPVFVLRGRSGAIDAKATLVDGEFLVLAGSTAAPRVASNPSDSKGTARAYQAFQTIRDGLEKDGVLVVDEDQAQFVKDAPFSSPSLAGAIVLGRSCNGRTSWATEEGLTYGQWESRGIQ